MLVPNYKSPEIFYSSLKVFSLHHCLLQVNNDLNCEGEKFLFSIGIYSQQQKHYKIEYF